MRITLEVVEKESVLTRLKNHFTELIESGVVSVNVVDLNAEIAKLINGANTYQVVING